MKSKAVALGHPIHPMLIPFPFAFLTGAVLFDAAGWFRDLPSWWGRTTTFPAWVMRYRVFRRGRAI